MSDERPASVTLVDLFDVEDDLLAGGETLAPAEPHTLDVWVVDAVLSRGPHGAVYACHNQHAPRIRAALKVAPADAPPAQQARFAQEARLRARLDHPRVVPVRNARLDHVPPFFEMPLLAGPTLQAALAEGPLPKDQQSTVTAGLCAALSALLDAGVHHRDLKPANVVLTEDGPVVVDFGLATTTAGACEPLDGLHGTPGYLPPEWAPDGVVSGEAWDRYALGVVLFEVCTGRRAFPVDVARGDMEQVFAVQKQVVATPHLDPGETVHPLIRSLVTRLTARAPAARQVDLSRAEALLRASGPPEGLEAGLPAPTPAPPVPSSAPVPADPRLGRVAAGVAMLGAVGLGAMVLLQPAPETRRGTVAVRLAVELVPADPGLPVHLTLDDQPFDVAQPPVLSPGAHAVVARMGEQCGAGALPVWCTEARTTVSVAADAHQHVLHRFELPAVPARAVSVETSGHPAEQVSVDGGPWRQCGAPPCTVSVLPGPARTFTIRAGPCPEAACDGDCPPGCVEQSTRLEVPFAASGALSVAIDLPVAAPSPAPVDSPPPPTRTGIGPAITVGAFQAFLQRHADYVPGGSAARADADAKYLPGWEGTVAKDRFTGAPLPARALIEGLSPRVAAAYCASRGGIARLSDGPPRLAGRDFELRQDDDEWVALDATGQTRPVPDGRTSLRHFTVRCRR